MAESELLAIVNSNPKVTLDKTLNTINTNVNSIKSSNLINSGSSVKSIQRGIVKTPVSGGNFPLTSVTVPISTVKISKCILLLDGMYSDMSPAVLRSASNTSLVITDIFNSSLIATNGNAMTFSWQLIEFY